MTVSAPPTQRLIPSYNRIKFVASYVFITIILWVLFGAFFSLSPVIPNLTLRVTLDAIVVGIIVGTGQWLVLRPYLSNWLWIMATAIGSGLMTLTLNLWYSALLQTMQQPDSNPFLEIFLSTPLSIILPVQGMGFLAFCLWFAGAQWLVLRRYVKAAVWWFLTPMVAILLVWLLLILQLIFLLSVILQQQVLLPGLLAAIQALMLCRFQRKDFNPTNEITDAGEEVSTGSFVGLVMGTIAGVLILSLSMQGFLIWFRVS